MDILERMPWIAKDAVFQRLASIAEVSALSKEDRQKYDESLRKFRDTISVMEGQYLEGEKKSLIEVARKMKAKAFDIETITEITGLTAEEIGAL